MTIVVKKEMGIDKNIEISRAAKLSSKPNLINGRISILHYFNINGSDLICVTGMMDPRVYIKRNPNFLLRTRRKLFIITMNTFLCVKYLI